MLPSQDLIKVYEQYDQRQSQAWNLNPEETKHFSSEYKRRFLLGSPEFQQRLRYVEAGEFAGRSSFKEPLVNKAPEGGESEMEGWNGLKSVVIKESMGEERGVERSSPGR